MYVYNQVCIIYIICMHVRIHVQVCMSVYYVCVQVAMREHACMHVMCVHIFKVFINLYKFINI